MLENLAGKGGSKSPVKPDANIAGEAYDQWDPTFTVSPPLSDIPLLCSADASGMPPSNDMSSANVELDLWAGVPQLDGNMNDIFAHSYAEMELSQFHFPDEAHLEVPELEILKTAGEFARLLHCEDTLWSMTALRTLDLTSFETDALPAVLRPTPAQRTVLHHPALDVIPWPSVRSKLIYVFNQPPDLRPPNARDDMALVRFIYDVDDSAEGVRVSGADRLDLGNWEVGQLVFQNWWWAFDNQILRNSDVLRARRGAPRLRITMS
jgi:hypothetical protein